MEQKILFICEDCGNTILIPVIESIIKRRYPFIDSFEMKMCSKCGNKYLICPKCQNILFRVHISLDPFDLKDKCPYCIHKFPDITAWVQNIVKKNL